MTDSFTDNNFLPVFDSLPDDWELSRKSLISYLKRVTEAVNFREIGNYYATEQLAGKNFIPLNKQNKPRTIYRKVLAFGLDDFSPGPPNDQPIPHGITIDSSTRFIHMYGTANNPGPEFIPITYVDADANTDNIEMTVYGTNVTLRSSKDYSNFTDCFIVLEYIKES